MADKEEEIDVGAKALEDAAALKAQEVMPEVAEEEEEDAVVAELSPEEQEATKLGWNRDYDGEGRVEAKEFLERKPLYDAIHKEKRKVKKYREQNELLAQEMHKQLQAGYEKAKAEIAARKKQAVAEGDTEAYDALERKEKEIPEPVVPDTSAADKFFEEWTENNDWYEADEVMTAFADGIGAKLMKENPELTTQELFENVLEKTKEAFPAKFSNPKKARESKVNAPVAKKRGGNNKPTMADLPDEVRQTAKHMIKPIGPFEPDEYIKLYLDRGGELRERG